METDILENIYNCRFLTAHGRIIRHTQVSCQRKGAGVNNRKDLPGTTP